MLHIIYSSIKTRYVRIRIDILIGGEKKASKSTFTNFKIPQKIYDLLILENKGNGQNDNNICNRFNGSYQF